MLADWRVVLAATTTSHRPGRIVLTPEWLVATPVSSLLVMGEHTAWQPPLWAYFYLRTACLHTVMTQAQAAPEEGVVGQATIALTANIRDGSLLIGDWSVVCDRISATGDGL
ncbi:hypothetical protein AAHC03_01807 [Spirometra sp. Aus1]